jgi:hypothetical protein
VAENDAAVSDASVTATVTVKKTAAATNPGVIFSGCGHCATG